MIFRLSQKLSAKFKDQVLLPMPLDENPFADWSAQWFVADRRPYILLCNTKALISTVMPGKGIKTENQFIEQTLSSIREIMQAEGKEDVYDQFIVPEIDSICFAKALNRSVTGSMNDMVKHAAHWLAQGNLSSFDIHLRLSEIPMSALKSSGSPYGFPRDVFRAMANSDKTLRRASNDPGGAHGEVAVLGAPVSSSGEPIQYVNRKGDRYFLHESKTKTGKRTWFFSKKTDGNLAATIPAGYEIYENHNAQVFLRIIVPMLVTKEEIATVEEGVRQFSKLSYFLVEAKNDSIVVFVANQQSGFLEESVASRFGITDNAKLYTAMQGYLTYLPMMRFSLVDEKRRRFAVERWCFLGSIDDWFPLKESGDLATMVKKFAPHLGEESFYELT
jgi:hypothetical protein